MGFFKDSIHECHKLRYWPSHMRQNLCISCRFGSDNLNDPTLHQRDCLTLALVSLGLQISWKFGQSTSIIFHYHGVYSGCMDHGTAVLVS